MKRDDPVAERSSSMATLDAWKKIVEGASNFAGMAQPLEALKQAGYDFGGPVAEALNKAGGVKPLNPLIFHRLKQAYGPPPRIQVRLGRTPTGPPLASYAAQASVDLQVVNDVLAEVWPIQTIRNHVSVSPWAIANLRAVCDGVPGGPEAALGDRDTAPPRVNAGSDNQHVQFDLFRLSEEVA